MPGIDIDLADVVNKIIDKIAAAAWGFVGEILGGLFRLIGQAGTPKIAYDPRGATGEIYPYLLYLGLALAVLMALGQAAWTAIKGVHSFLRLAIGMAQYMVAWGAALGMLQIIAGANDAIANGMIKIGFDGKGWSAVGSETTFMGQAVQDITGLGLLVLSLCFILPFAFALLLEVCIRYGGIQLIAATFPLLISGLLNEKFTSWFWKGLRWVLALIFMTSALALAMCLGYGMARAAGSGGIAPDGSSAILVAMVGVAALGLALLAPMAMFKLFAFVDPNTPAGARTHGMLAGGVPNPFKGGGSASTADSGSAPADASDEASTEARTEAATRGTGAKSTPSPGSGAAGAEAGAGGGGSTAGGGAGASLGVAGAVAGAVAGMAWQKAKANADPSSTQDLASDAFDAVGAGHPGRGGSGGGGGDGLAPGPEGASPASQGDDVEGAGMPPEEDPATSDPSPVYPDPPGQDAAPEPAADQTGNSPLVDPPGTPVDGPGHADPADSPATQPTVQPQDPGRADRVDRDDPAAPSDFPDSTSTSYNTPSK